MVEIFLIGRSNLFGLLLAQRLERIDINTKEANGIQINCWTSGEADDCDLLIRPVNSESYPAKAKCELVLHDLYIPGGSGDWGPSEIELMIDWLNDPESSQPQGQPRYWIHVRDVVDMIVNILPSLPDGSLDVVGRRCWSHEAMTSELAMLFSRVKAAETKTFQLDNLKIFEPKTEPNQSPPRPNLGPLHTLCESVGVGGWHPLVPFRVGLMECIAYQLESV
jgi:nucleoside-diphosphate-sugar epimerase